MVRYLQIIIVGILFSFYYFPFAFNAFPEYNTKTIMAFVGMVLIAVRMLVIREYKASKEMFVLFILALAVSLCGVLAIVINETNDTTYALYIRSAVTWLCAAYLVCAAMKKAHSYIDVGLVAKYLIGVCVCQCITVLLIEFVPSFKNIVDTYIMMGHARMEAINRLYGIGVALDVGGSRMAVALVVAMFYIVKQFKEKQFPVFFVLGYIIIAVVGNMVARTTSVGLLVSIIYLLIIYKPWIGISYKSLKIALALIALLLIAISVLYHLYQTNVEVHSLLRFAFESFFNYVERGEFESASTNALKTMFVFPETMRTWIIGDGYFMNPHFADPTYVGDSPAYGYYMGTDVGYCRFIFYFGLIGLSAFIVYMMYAVYIPACKFPREKAVFFMIGLCNMLIWVKVSTDVFLALALFICVANMQSDSRKSSSLKLSGS